MERRGRREDRHRGKRRLEAKRNVTETQAQRLRGRVGEKRAITKGK